MPRFGLTTILLCSATLLVGGCAKEHATIDPVPPAPLSSGYETQSSDPYAGGDYQPYDPETSGAAGTSGEVMVVAAEPVIVAEEPVVVEPAAEPVKDVPVAAPVKDGSPPSKMAAVLEPTRLPRAIRSGSLPRSITAQD